MRRILETLILFTSIFLMFCGIYFLVEHFVLEHQNNFVVYKILERSAYLAYGEFYCGATNIKNGVFITASHCVNDISENDKAILKVYSGKEFKFKKIVLVKRRDLALIFTNDDDKNNEEGPFGGKIKISSPSLGEEVYVVGHALGEFFTVRKAIVAKLYDNRFIIDTNIWFGDSGGGVFNARGDLVGVITTAETIPIIRGGIGFPMWGWAEYIPKEVIYVLGKRE
jgi:hypothetical protein